MASSPFLYFAGDRLSLAELSAARLDGDVVELGDAYIPADAVETRALRAGSMAGILGENLAATHLSAAWIHGVLYDAPVRHTVQRAVPRRLHRLPARSLVYRDLAVDVADLELIGGVLVTAGLRTLCDLARVEDPLHREAAVLLAKSRPGLADESIDRLRRGALPHKRQAIAFLRSLTAVGDQDDVTR